MKPVSRSVRIIHECDTCEQPESLESCRANYAGCTEEEITEYLDQDAARINAYDRCEWSYIGIYVECETLADGILQTIRTPGVWRIESDSGDDHFASVIADEFAILRDQLECYNVDTSNLDALMSCASTVTR